MTADLQVEKIDKMQDVKAAQTGFSEEKFSIRAHEGVEYSIRAHDEAGEEEEKKQTEPSSQFRLGEEGKILAKGEEK
jgi:HSP20 family molecular chaperone IbpA